MLQRVRREVRIVGWLLLSLTMPVCAAAAEPVPTVSEIEWVGVSALSTRDLEGRVLTTAKSWKPWVEPRPFDESNGR